MALTVSMTTDARSNASIATITGDPGNDELIVDIAKTLSAIADGDHLVVDITDTQNLDTHHLDQLLDHTPDHVIIVYPTDQSRSARMAASLSDALQRLGGESASQMPQMDSSGDHGRRRPE